MTNTIIAGTKAGIRVFGIESGDPVDGADVTTLAVDEGVLWALLDHRHVCRIRSGKAERVATVDGPIGWCLLVDNGVAWVGTAKAIYGSAEISRAVGVSGNV